MFTLPPLCPTINPGGTAAWRRVIKSFYTHYFFSVFSFCLQTKPDLIQTAHTGWRCVCSAQRRKTIDGLSDSNPNTQKKGGGKVCPIVTPSERSDRKKNRRGMVCKVPIFIQTLQWKMQHLCPTELNDNPTNRRHAKHVSLSCYRRRNYYTEFFRGRQKCVS